MLPLALAMGAGALISAFSQNRNTRKAIASQEKQQALTRQHNLELAYQQNVFNQQMWERNNEYNSPLNQINRLQAAGLNPNLAMSSGMMPQSVAPEMITGAPAQNDVNYEPLSRQKTFGDVVQDTLSTMLASKSIDKLSQDILGQREQNRITKSDADFRDKLNEGVVNLQNLELDLGVKKGSLTDAQVAKISSDIRNSDVNTQYTFSKIAEVQSYIKNMDADTLNKRIDNAFKSDLYQAQIKQIKAETGLSHAQAHDILSTLTLRMLELDGKVNLMSKQAIHTQQQSASEMSKRALMYKQGLVVDTENKRLQFNLKMDEKYMSAERTAQIANLWTSSAANATKTIMNVLNPL